jgi:single-stranded DNA-binding protein
VVIGRLQQRSWTAEDGSARSTAEVVAEELGPSLRGRRPCRPGSPRTAAPSDSWWSLSHPLMAPPWTGDFR